MKSRWAYALRAEASALEIDIYDVIGAGLMGGITAQDVLSQLKEQKDPKQILVRINSAGGEVTQGMAIYSLLREAAQNGAQVTCRIDGVAASIASIIACAGDKVEMADSAFFMIHNPSAIIEGGASDLRSMADLLETMRTQMLGIYQAKTGKPTDDLANLCDAETWMTAQEALALGFITDVVPARTARMAAQAKWDLTQFRKVPKGLGATNMTDEEAKALEAENQKLKAKIAKLEEDAEKDKDEKAKAAAAPPPKKEDGDDDDDQDDDDDKDKGDAKASAVARVLAAAQAITGVQDEDALEGALYALSVKAKGTRSTKAQHAEKVTKAIAEGKLTPSLKKLALEWTPKALDQYLTSLGDAVLVPVGQEIQQPPEAAVKALANLGAPLTELSKSERALAKSFALSDEQLQKIKAGNAA